MGDGDWCFERMAEQNLSGTVIVPKLKGSGDECRSISFTLNSVNSSGTVPPSAACLRGIASTMSGARGREQEQPIYEAAISRAYLFGLDLADPRMLI
jgi:hypothetical protein